MKKFLVFLVALAYSPDLVLSFQSVVAEQRLPRSPRHTGRYHNEFELSMCICIHCARVTNCAAYHFVESKHSQPHMTDDPSFTPREGSPTIHANIRTVKQDDVLNRLFEEHEAEEQSAEAAASEDHGDSHRFGKTVYDLSSATTIEYDVVACEDFLEDKDCWVRNMPELIRLANPNFIPS